MSSPKRIQRRRTRGWRMPPGAVYVGRPTRWGNPYSWSNKAGHDGQGSRQAVVDVYRIHLANHPELVAAARQALAGRDLACWCPVGQHCHADVLLEIANGGAA